MAAITDRFTVIFPPDYDARAEYETPSKGYLADVIVQLDEAARYRLFFMDPVRLAQELEDDVHAGKAYFAEPNLIVLPRVTTESIRKAVEGLVKEDFFRDLKPL